MAKRLKLIVHVPESHADTVRTALGEAGAGRVGEYGFCSFTTKGIGRFKPLDGANPAIGAVGQFEEVVEESIEIVLAETLIHDVLAVLREVHPYEEPAYEVYELAAY